MSAYRLSNLGRYVSLAFCFLSLSQDIVTAQCGVERWPLKILTDSLKNKIKWNEKTSTVSEQGKLGRPFKVVHGKESGWLNSTRHNTESYTYSITGILTHTGRSADKDYHLVLRDLKNSATMICEIPDPDNCSEVQKSAKAGSFRRARQMIDKKFGKPPGSIKKLAKADTVVIHGVGFWDKRDHGTGHAKNGRELHPVFKIDTVIPSPGQ
jgi:hypothetical protein